VQQITTGSGTSAFIRLTGLIGLVLNGLDLDYDRMIDRSDRWVIDSWLWREKVNPRSRFLVIFHRDTCT